MKYIDAGTTAEKISNEFEIPMSELCDVFADIPSADVQPVKRGHWIEVSPKHSQCSCCEATCLIAVYPISAHANFCPNCGARMDGDT